MSTPAEFTDPRLVELYDTVCPPGPDDAFHIGLADRLDAATVVDIGCGTGTLAVALARPGRRVIGVDPAAAMLTVAWPKSFDVEWLDGTAADVPDVRADLAVMKAHVPQLIAADAEWEGTLDAIARFVRPGGHLAFESRDPRTMARGAGEDWGRPRSFEHPRHGRFEVQQGPVRVEPDAYGGTTVAELRYRFADGTTAASTTTLRFRSCERLTAQLDAAGFDVEDVFGDFDRRPVGPDTGELVVVAVRR